PHANCVPEEVLQGGADIVVVGEGEITVVELMDCLLGGDNLDGVDGLCCRNSRGQATITKPRALVPDLDTMPQPDFSSFPIERYTGSTEPDSHPTFWSLFTSRGCPFNCTFCSSHNVFGRKFRTRSPQNILEECVALNKNFGASFFAFQDDEAFINKKRIIEFCKLVQKSNCKFGFSARLRIDSVTSELLAEMKAAGFKRMAFGIDSWHDESLRLVNKSYGVKEILSRFKVVTSADIPAVYFNIIAGFPWETRDHFRVMLKHIGQIDKNVLFFASLVTPIPYPKTKLYDDYHEQFGFKQWWLKPEMNSRVAYEQLWLGPYDAKCPPFFMDYCDDNYFPLYQKEPFWRQDKEMIAALEWFSWKLFAHSLRRMVSLPEYLFILWGSKLSHGLWCRWPKLEQGLFRLPRRLATKFRLLEKTNFSKRSQ
ncbi:MAG: radical SAM protein, partial [Humidesulfovibrio sp.]|nr:radical SAM protein [Humidesulfovibrio sp.]